MGPQFTVSDSDSSLRNERLDDPIVIVGASCRLAGEASSLDRLWNLMKDSRTAHAKVPKDRWNADAWYHPDPDRKGSLNTTHGFFLEQDIAAFDAPFFTVNAKEAAGMDPAKRLLLEVAYEAFENAGMPVTKIAGTRTGVYVGSMTSDYEVLSTRDMYDEPHMAASGSSEAMTANRVSWFFDFRGPSLTLDTACSSSLYALHLACQSLRLGETDMGLVAGVSVMLHPNFMHQLVAMHMLSPDGTSHTFDDRANGYGRGEGIGALVVKRLSDAIRDGDTIRAVIRGVRSNTDGKTPSVTMPSSEAQASLIREVYQEAGLPLDSTPYVELHGTGTPVGDPIELSAIATTFGANAPRDQPVYVGSIKPNVGHTEGCAGLAGVFKALLSLERGIILPTAAVQTINPKLEFERWNIALPKGPLAWPANRLRRISVNSFGFGGANAHVILDGAAQYLKERGLKGKTSEDSFDDITTTSKTSNMSTSGKHKLFVLSSRDEAGVARMAKSLSTHLDSKKGIRDAPLLSNLAYTLASRRSELEYRSFAVAESIQDLAHKLALPGTFLPRALRQSAKHNRIAFIFTGQGAQWAGMGRQLHGESDVFTKSIARSSRCLQTLGCEFTLEEELQRMIGSKIETAEYSQPICTAVQIALVDLLREWKVFPAAVAGHSSGEIAAAYAARLITHEDAIKVAYIRGIYSGMVARGSRLGGMLAAGISEEEAQNYLSAVAPESVVVACVNSPQSVTLSGDADVVSQLEALISADGKFARKLRVMTAYHSPHMRAVAEGCLQAMLEAGVNCKTEVTDGQEAIPMFSSVTGELVDPAELDPTYWIRNMCGTVRFAPAVANLLTGNLSPSSKRRATGRKAVVKWDALVEVGPHSALKAPLVQILEGLDSKLPSQLVYTSLLVRKEDALVSVKRAAGTLWAAGVKIPLDVVNKDDIADPGAYQKVLVDLPTYVWNHEKRFWHESPATKQQRLQGSPRTDLLGAPVENFNPLEPQWRNQLRVRENPWVEDHKITGTILYPGAGMLIMVIEAVTEIAIKSKEVQGIEFKNVSFEKGLVIPQDGSTETILRIQHPQIDGFSVPKHSFSIFSRVGDAPWVRNCFGRFRIMYKTTEGAEAMSDASPATFEWKRYFDRYAALKQLNATPVDVSKLYERLENVGMQYGPTFQNVTELYTVPGVDCCYGTARIPDTKSVMPFEYEFPHLIHPATLDAIFHLMVVVVAGGEGLTEAAVPSMLEELYISFDLPQGHGQEFSGYAERVTRRDDKLCADLVVSDSEWRAPKVVVKGLIMSRVSSDSGGANLFSRNGEYEKKACKLIWKLEPDIVMQRSSNSHLDDISSLRDWLTLECHKTTQLKVAFLAGGLSADVLHDLVPFVTGKSPYRGLSQLSVIELSEDALELWKPHVTTAEITINYLSRESWTQSDARYDLIIVGQSHAEAVGELDSYRSKMERNGRLVVLKTPQTGSLTNGSNGVRDSQPPNEDLNSTSDAAKHESIAEVRLGGTSKITVLMDRAEKLPCEDEVLLLVPKANKPSRGSQLLGDRLSKSSVSTRVVGLKEVALLQQKTIICLLDGSFLTKWTLDEFNSFRDLISSAKSIFWITHGTQMLQPSQRGVQGAGVPGLLRVLRNEFPQVTLRHLDLSFELDAADAHSVELVAEVFLQQITRVEDEHLDLELAEVNGQILIPRVISDTGLDEDIALATGKAQLIHKSLDTCGPLQLVSSGIRDTKTYWRKDEDSDMLLDADDVEVAVTDISIYPLSAGSTTKKSQIGSLVTGFVTQCGSNVNDLVKNDLVVVFGLPICKTIVKQHQSLVAKVDREGSGSAAHLWVELITSYILDHVVHLASAQKILVQDANTPLGKALIRRAAGNFRAHIQATVQSAEQRDELVSELGLPKDAIIISSSAGSSRALFSHILEQTGGTGIDVVVYAGNSFLVDEEVGLCLSDLARIAIVVAPDQPMISLPLFGGNIGLFTVDPLRILTEQPRLVSTLLKSMGVVKIPETASSNTFAVSELDEAIQTANSSASGIVSISLLPKFGGTVPEVPILPAALGMPKLDSSATYILAGGLGSLGLRVAELMAANGATHLVFLSRSGGNRHNSKLKKLHGIGCETLVLTCDVTSDQSVIDMVVEVGKTGRPIKGLLQCAMVLQDSLFDKMTYDQWHTAFRPKVDGTWNLHTRLPKDMDFFVMLSSVVSVIGNVSQANYAAGNSYMDALAHFRRSLGMAATSINAGLVADSDHTIDGTSMEDYLDRFKHMASVSTTLSELDIAVAASMRGTVGNSERITSPQFVFCMTDSLQPASVDFWASDAKFMHRVLRDGGAGQSSEARAGQEASLSAVLAVAITRDDAQGAIQAFMKNLLAPSMGVQSSEVDAERPLFELGVDSFKAVEVRTQVSRQLKCDISVFEILSPNSLAYLANQLVSRSPLVPALIQRADA